MGCETWNNFRNAVYQACGGEDEDVEEGNGCWENAEANYIGSSINKRSISGSCILYLDRYDNFPNYIGFNSPLPDNSYFVKLTDCCACTINSEPLSYSEDYFFKKGEEYHIRCGSRPIQGTLSINNTLGLENKIWYSVDRWLTGAGNALGKLQALLSSRANNLLTKNTTITCTGGSCLGSNGGTTDEYVTLPASNDKGVFSHGLAWFGRLSISNGMVLYTDGSGDTPHLTDFTLIVERIPREIQAIKDTAKNVIQSFPEGMLKFEIISLDQIYNFSCRLEDIELTSRPTDESGDESVVASGVCIPTTFTLTLPGCLNYLPTSMVVYRGADTFNPITTIIDKLREIKEKVLKMEPEGVCERLKDPEEAPPTNSGSECLKCGRGEIDFYPAVEAGECFSKAELMRGVDEYKIGDSIDFSDKRCGLYHIEKYVNIPPLDESEIFSYEDTLLHCCDDVCGGCGQGNCCEPNSWEPTLPCHKPWDQSLVNYEEKEKQLWGGDSSTCLCAYTIDGAGTIYTIDPSGK